MRNDNMERAKNNLTQKLLYEALSIAVAVIFAIALPQVFHDFGKIIGMDNKIGQMFLPMYLPVLVLSFKVSTVAGIIGGILSPVISFTISGMPSAATLPLIIIELACFGLFAGIIRNRTKSLFTQILFVQISSKIVRIIATIILSCFISNFTITFSIILNTTIIAIPGYNLQLLVVPYFVGKSDDNE